MASTLAAASGVGARRPWRPGRTAKGAAGILAFLVLWQISVPLVGLEPYFYPAPADVAAAFVTLIAKGILPDYLLASLGRYVAGVAIGASLGVALGLAIGLSRFVDRLLAPTINFMFAIVEVAWIPIFVIWFGYGLKTILIALSYVVLFPVLYNTLVGIRGVPPVLINAVRALGATRAQLVREVILPAALPNIITGFRVGAGFAFRGLVFAEIIAATSGIGYLIFQGAQNQQTARTVVGMIVMGLMWLLIDWAYLKPLERATIERWGQVTAAEARE
jgi:NitT/TauT family transport system permease protein/taurine transport system permease protein